MQERFECPACENACGHHHPLANAFTPDNDDAARGDFGIVAGGDVPRDRLGSQRPFAIVIVGGLMVNLAMSVFILPTLYVWFARRRDTLPEPEGSFEI